MIVKICGITRVEDAHAAVAHGASALGFVFWPASPRFIDPFRARKIVATLPPFVASVGVFVNQPAADVRDIAQLVPLSVIQLHGDETPEFAASLSRPVLKAVDREPSPPDSWPERVTLLVDAMDRTKRGGTGRTADWTMAATLARKRRIVLAGGLSPENVAEAVSRVRPFGVDVSSGVELAPGIKDERRIAALFSAIAEGQEVRS